MNIPSEHPHPGPRAADVPAAGTVTSPCCGGERAPQSQPGLRAGIWEPGDRKSDSGKGGQLREWLDKEPLTSLSPRVSGVCS